MSEGLLNLQENDVQVVLDDGVWSCQDPWCAPGRYSDYVTHATQREDCRVLSVWLVMLCQRTKN